MDRQRALISTVMEPKIGPATGPRNRFDALGVDLGGRCSARIAVTGGWVLGRRDQNHHDATGQGSGERHRVVA
jgi:hypothetical protein